MTIQYAGELAALATAVSWSVSAVLFDQVSKRAGTFPVNTIKGCYALLFISIYLAFTGSNPLPSEVPLTGWTWLGFSGLTGFIIGDLFLFQAFIILGARVSMVIYALAPAMTAVGGYIFFGEKLTALSAGGMGLTLSGIVLVVLSRQAPGSAAPEIRFKGVVFAFLATVCQAAGYLMSKQGLMIVEPVRATQIRLITAAAGFILMMLLTGRTASTIRTLTDRYISPRLLTASFFGPFLGVTLSMYAINNAKAGIASAIISMTPVILILPAVLILKEKVTFREAAGAVIAVTGNVLFFI